MRILFFGTPEFAVPSLARILEAGYEVVAVITAPDKPAGRGLQLKVSEVKRFAAEKNLTLFQPEELSDPGLRDRLQLLHPDLGVVVAFRKLPESIWSLPIMGSFNLHASLLPEYRGAAPIQWAIINGETETGLTTFFISHSIDTGAILLQEKLSIGANETAEELHDRLKHAGADLVLRTIRLIEAGTAETYSQDLSGLYKKAPKILSAHSEIKWTHSAGKIHNLIRGLSPVPGASTLIQGKKIKLLRSQLTSTKTHLIPGTMSTENGDLFIACADEWLQIVELHPEGKKVMRAEDFLRGFRLKPLSGTEKKA